MKKTTSKTPAPAAPITPSEAVDQANAYYRIKTAIDNKTREAKDIAILLKRYAEQNLQDFEDNTLRLGDHVRIELRNSAKCEYDVSKLTPEKLVQILINGGASLLHEIKFDAKPVQEVESKALTTLLNSIDLVVVNNTDFIIYKQK